MFRVTSLIVNDDTRLCINVLTWHDFLINLVKFLISVEYDFSIMVVLKRIWSKKIVKKIFTCLYHVKFHVKNVVKFSSDFKNRINQTPLRRSFQTTCVSCWQFCYIKELKVKPKATKVWYPIDSIIFCLINHQKTWGRCWALR